MSEFRGDGLDCKCNAYGQCECACGADWTTKKEWEQERKIRKLEERVKEYFNALENCIKNREKLSEDKAKLESTIAEMVKVLEECKNGEGEHWTNLDIVLTIAIDSALRIAKQP